MLRRLLTGFARSHWVRKAALSTPFFRGLAWSFVAGEDQAAGLDAVRRLNARGIAGTLNCIGTHVRDVAEAAAATDMAVEGLARIRDLALDSHVSVKLTQIGLDIDLGRCRANLARILEAAQRHQGFVRIDMEESAYVDATLDLFEDAYRTWPVRVGIVLQSYLRRNAADLERMVALGAGIRLVKGGYWESGAVAWRAKADIDAAFLRDMDYILRHGGNLALASHDGLAIGKTLALAEHLGLSRDAFEFQLLYGVRGDLAEDLVRQGCRVRCYVPYGSRWYEYVLGCIRRDPGRVFQPREAHHG